MSSPCVESSPSARIVNELNVEHAWAAIARRHRELPPAVLIVGAGSGEQGTRRMLRLGHFGAERWRLGDDEQTKAGHQNGPVAAPFRRLRERRP